MPEPRTANRRGDGGRAAPTVPTLLSKRRPPRSPGAEARPMSTVARSHHGAGVSSAAPTAAGRQLRPRPRTSRCLANFAKVSWPAAGPAAGPAALGRSGGPNQPGPAAPLWLSGSWRAPSRASNARGRRVGLSRNFHGGGRAVAAAFSKSRWQGCGMVGRAVGFSKCWQMWGGGGLTKPANLVAGPCRMPFGGFWFAPHSEQ